MDLEVADIIVVPLEGSKTFLSIIVEYPNVHIIGTNDNPLLAGNEFSATAKSWREDVKEFECTQRESWQELQRR